MATPTKPKRRVSEATRLYSIPGAADVLGVSVRTVYRLIEQGRLRAIDISESPRPRARVRADDLQQFIDVRTPESAFRRRRLAVAS
ncbi:helix-turn-helix domain-containing protein [Micrococcus sp. IITD107]|uniref:helix-turn-helix domain-containing protein n=1 Tax=Micrococcus sp. IITD107 TaxID=3342790 RepID=UPI0035B6B2D1